MTCFHNPRHNCGECCDSGYRPTFFEDEPYGDITVSVAKEFEYCSCQKGLACREDDYRRSYLSSTRRPPMVFSENKKPDQPGLFWAFNPLVGPTPFIIHISGVSEHLTRCYLNGGEVDVYEVFGPVLWGDEINLEKPEVEIRDIP